MNNKKKKIGLVGCLCLGIGCIVGSGIFGSLPEVTNNIGSGVIWALIASTFVVILRGLPAVYSTAALPTSARHFMHQTKLLHPYVGALQAFNSILITSMLALYGVLFAEYFLDLFPNCPLGETAIAIILVVVFCVLALFGNKISSNVENLMVVIMMVTLVLYVTLGLPNLDPDAISLKQIFLPGLSISGFSAAVGVLTSCVSGGAIIAEISDDVANPKKNIPLAIILCPAIVCILYILIGIVTVGAGLDGASTLTEVARKFMSPGLVIFFVAGGPIIGILTSFVPFLLAMVSEFDYISRQRLFPNFLSAKNKHGVAHYSVLFALLITVAIIATGQTFGVIMVIFSFANIIEETPNTLIPFAATKKYPKSCEHSPNIFPRKLIYITSVISLLIMIYLAVQLFLSMDVSSWIAVAVTYIGGYIYMFARARYLKVKEDYDLIKELARPYEPWEEQEKKL